MGQHFAQSGAAVKSISIILRLRSLPLRTLLVLLFVESLLMISLIVILLWLVLGR